MAKGDIRDKSYITTSDYAGGDRRRGEDHGRRMTEHNGNGNGRDWTSLRAWAQAVGIVGIPGAIAIFLVYVGATQVPQLVRQLEIMGLEIRQNREAIREHTTQLNVLIQVTQRSCMNSAKDDNARQNCFER